MQMNRVRLNNQIRQAKEELNLLRLAMMHVEDRIEALDPTINTTARFYKELLEDKASLTIRIRRAILYLYETGIKTNQSYLTDNGIVRPNRPSRSRV